MSGIPELFDTLRARLAENPSKVAGLTASFLFDLTGPGGGAYHAVFNDGAPDMGEGAVENPDVTVTVAAEVFQAVATGKMNPAAAFMTGKLKVKGDMSKAMRLHSIIG